MGRKDLHRSDIVRTAMRLFRRQGYAATGVLQIVAESGAPKGSLYHYFPKGKEELATEAVALAGDLVAEMLVDELAKAKSLKSFLSNVSSVYARWMKEGAYVSGCPIATTMLECAPDTPEIAAAGANAFERWIDIVAQAYEKEGVAKPAARRSAEAFIAALEGALILARVRKSADPLKNVGHTFASLIKA